MQRSRARMLVPLVLTFGLLAAACGSSSSSTDKGGNGGSTSPTKDAATKLAAATLNGSGSTFQLAFDEAVISEFQTAQPAVKVVYSTRSAPNPPWLAPGQFRLTAAGSRCHCAAGFIFPMAMRSMRTMCCFRLRSIWTRRWLRRSEIF